MSDQTIQEHLAATWESHMHDGNGVVVTGAFLNVLHQMKEEGEFRPFDLQNRVISTTFQPFEDSESGGLAWALMSNAVSAMAREFVQWLGERKAARNV